MSHHTLVHCKNRAAAAASGLCIALLCGGCPRSTVWLGKSELSFHDAGRAAPNDAPDAAPASAGHAGAEPSAGHDAGTAGNAASASGAGGDTTLPATAGAGGSSGAAAGSGGASGSVAIGTGGAGAAGGAGPSTPQLPSASEPCPTFATGTVKVLGVDVQLWVGASSASRAAPVLIYWHGPGSNSGEPTFFFAAPVDDVVRQGGVVASPAVSTAKGDPDATSTWYTGDFALADEIVACAVQQRNIDPRRIYVTGCSYGGVQADSMAYARSGYIAAAVSNSGGAVTSSGALMTSQMLQNPAHVPPVMTLHGAHASDVAIVDFSDASLAMTRDVVSHGGFAVDCDHQGGQCGSPDDLQAAAWQFLQDHPFGVQPEPYAAGLPASFPSYCKIQ